MIWIRRLVLTALAVLVAVNPVALADTKINQVPTVGNINPTDSLMIMRPDVSAPGGTALKQVPLSLLLSAGSSSASAAKLAAPPATGTWKLGDVVYNSAPAPGAAYAWLCVTAGSPGVWAPIATIGAALAASVPTPYTITLNSPTDGSTVTGIISLSVQAPSLKNVELWNSSKTRLAGGVPGSDATGALTLTYDTNNLPNGPNSLSLNGWDVAAWVNGGNAPDQQPTHTATPLAFTLNVSNNASGTPALTSVSIMGLGDSITAGQGGSGLSYRPELKTKLGQSGITVSYVGSQSDGTYSHEGYPGKGVDDLIDKVNASPGILALNPNVVVVEIGTNDNSAYVGAKNAPAYAIAAQGGPSDGSGTTALFTRFGVLLDAIHGKVPNAYIVVSNLLPRTGSNAVSETAFNGGIGAVISARSSSSYHVYLVDDNSNFPSSTGLADGLHPNDTVGYPWLGDQIASTVLTALRSSGTGSTSPPSSTVTAPSYATAAGFSNLAYDVESWTPSLIDVNDTRQPGFKLYRARPFGMGPLGTQYFSVNGDGTLTITGDGAGPNYSLGTTAPSGSGYTGFTVSGGAYFEAKIRVRGRGDSSSWASYWIMDAPHLWQNTCRGGEMDILEDLGAGNGWPSSQIAFTIHDWYWCGGGTSQQSDPVVEMGSAFDISQWHAYGMLWKPATSSSQGSATFYVDGVAKKTVTWSQGGTFAINDTLAQPLIFGTGSAAPMDIGYVRVFH